MLYDFPCVAIYHKREEICLTLATSNIIWGAGTNSLGTLLLSKYISVLMLAYQHNIIITFQYYNNVHKILTFGTNGAPLIIHCCYIALHTHKSDKRQRLRPCINNYYWGKRASWTLGLRRGLAHEQQYLIA